MNQQTTELSPQFYRVFKLLRDNPDEWLTSSEVSTSGKVAPRTARAHLLTLTKLGVLDVAPVFPGYKYRWAKLAEKKNPGFVNRMETLAQVLGLGKPNGVNAKLRTF